MPSPPTTATPPGHAGVPLGISGSAPLAVPPKAPGPGLSPPGFGDGFASIFSGLRFVVTSPSVWLLAIVPAIVLIAITAAVGFGGYEALSPHVVHLLGKWAHTSHGALAVVARVLTAALSIGVGFLLGMVIAQPIAGPALERIVRRVDASIGVPPQPETTLVSDVLRSIEGLLVTTALGAPLFAFLFLLDFVIPPIAIVTTPIKIAATALLAAWDLCDYPLSIRGVGIRERVALLRRHLRAVFGFAAAITLLSMVPCALFFALPIGVAGAAHLIHRIETYEGLARRP